MWVAVIYMQRQFVVILFLIAYLGSRDGTELRRLCLLLLWPMFDSQILRGMWVMFAVGSRPCSEGLSTGPPVFLPP